MACPQCTEPLSLFMFYLACSYSHLHLLSQARRYFRHTSLLVLQLPGGSGVEDVGSDKPCAR